MLCPCASSIAGSASGRDGPGTDAPFETIEKATALEDYGVNVVLICVSGGPPIVSTNLLIFGNPIERAEGIQAQMSRKGADLADDLHGRATYLGSLCRLHPRKGRYWTRPPARGTAREGQNGQGVGVLRAQRIAFSGDDLKLPQPFTNGARL